MKTKSLLDRIKAAPSQKEAMKLVKEGESFQYAHPATRRKWLRVANNKN